MAMAMKTGEETTPRVDAQGTDRELPVETGRGGGRYA
jgi:hypothetical protein